MVILRLSQHLSTPYTPMSILSSIVDPLVFSTGGVEWPYNMCLTTCALQHVLYNMCSAQQSNTRQHMSLTIALQHVLGATKRAFPLFCILKLGLSPESPTQITEI